MENNCALTTIDNPFNPFENFSEWLLFDKEKGYNTCEYLARVANVLEDNSDQENNLEEERAIDEILEHDFRCIYKKVYRFGTKDTAEDAE